MLDRRARKPGLTKLVLVFLISFKYSWKIVCTTMLYMIFYYGWELVLIKRILIGLEAILEKHIHLLIYLTYIYISIYLCRKRCFHVLELNSKGGMDLKESLSSKIYTSFHFFPICSITKLHKPSTVSLVLGACWRPAGSYLEQRTCVFLPLWLIIIVEVRFLTQEIVTCLRKVVLQKMN